MSSKKTLLGIIAAGAFVSFISQSSTEAAPHAPQVAVVEAAPLPQPLRPVLTITDGDPTLPTAYYLFDVHYDVDLAIQVSDARFLLFDKIPEERRAEIEHGEELVRSALTCQTQMYRTLEQLYQEKKISLLFEEGEQQGIAADYSAFISKPFPNMKTATPQRQNDFLRRELSEIIKYQLPFGTGFFSVLYDFPSFGFESIDINTLYEIAHEAETTYRAASSYFVEHGNDSTYLTLEAKYDAAMEKVMAIDKQRSDAAYDNSLSFAKEWLQEHPSSPKGYVVNIGKAHELDVLRRFIDETHPNAVFYTCEG